ncbi:MAG: LysR family transcriptional regulator [Comamonas sp.]|uniref:LysR family transcriptional regulator n=1 Tax=Comamonas sp. TaxID=34028 RepID=UPI002FC5D260
MRNLNLDQLQTLIAIADLGTFAAAAQALHLAPPTVSLHIKELELRMDATLLVRGRKQAELTASGLVLVDEGRKLLTASHDLMERVQRRASGREGLVRVGVSAGVSTRLLPMMLESLSLRSPGVEVRLEAEGSAQSMRRLGMGQLDVAIVASPQPAAPGIQLVPWRVDPLVALLPATWDAPEKVTPEWLSQRRWASFSAPTQMHGLIANWFAQAGYQPRPFLALTYPGALKSLAAASQSAAILPLEEVEDQLHQPGVQIRHLFPTLLRPMAVAHRQNLEQNPAIEHVLAVLNDFASETR